MLNRMAESFYWIGRYTERIDYTARLINVNYYAHHRLSETENHIDDFNNRFAAFLTNVPSEKRREIRTNSSEMLDFMTFDRTYVNSILNCLSRARDNVRLVRQYASNRMWDSMNTFYLWLSDQNSKRNLEQMPYLFFEKVRNEVALFQGITDSSMLHEMEWKFFQAGKLLERTENVVRIMHMFFVVLEKEQIRATDIEYHRLVSLLESVDGYEAFRKLHANEVTLERVVEFLILNAVFPNSIYFSISQLDETMKGTQFEFQLDQLAKLNKLVSRYRTLIFQSLDLKGKSIEQHRIFLDTILAGCTSIGQEMNKCFLFDRGEDLSENFPRKLAKML
jgi:uncharacterized alpha-E superfamily protein